MSDTKEIVFYKSCLFTEENLLLEKNQLQGTIPTRIAQMTNLQFLSLKENNLSGTISTLLGMLTRLNYIVLSTNNLSSTIPSELGKLSSLGENFYYRLIFNLTCILYTKFD